jgi:hypothetical protein
MGIPENVRANGVQAHCPGFEQSVTPVFAWNTVIMHLTGKYTKGFAVQKELISGNGEASLRKSRSSVNEQGGDQYW